MEQESKSMEIQRYEPEGYKDHLGFRIPGECTTDPEGEYVLYADHAAAMKAAQDAIAVEHRALLNANAALREDADRMRVMREALEKARHKLCYHLLYDGEMKDFRCGSCKIIDAALASTAPVAEVVDPEEIPFTDSCIGCGKKFTEVQICCDKGCTHDGVLHRKGLCEGCCGCEPVAPVAEAGQLPTNDERLRMYESDEINGGSK